MIRRVAGLFQINYAVGDRFEERVDSASEAGRDQRTGRFLALPKLLQQRRAVRE